MDAIKDDLDEIVLEGHVMSPRLHLTLHEEVANQIWHDDPPEMWITAQRLTDAGCERHTVLHMLSSVVSVDIYNAMTGRLTPRSSHSESAAWSCLVIFASSR